MPKDANKADALEAELAAAQQREAELEKLLHEAEKRRDAPPEKLDSRKWPAWFYSSDGRQGRIFKSPDDVPEGWVDTPGGVKAAPKA